MMHQSINMKATITRTAFIATGVTVFVYLLFHLIIFLSENTKSAIKSVTADELLVSFIRNETSANQQYLSKTIQVYGKVSDIVLLKDNQVEITLAGTNYGSVLCTLKPEKIFGIIDSIEIDDDVLIRGNCIGFLNDVYLNNCTIFNSANIKQLK